MTDNDEILMSLEDVLTKGDIASEDHETKNDRSVSELEDANLKMTGKIKGEKAKKEDAGYVIVNGKKLHKRTDEDYAGIWEAFLDIAENEFREYMGYGKEEIENIGIKKFIDAYDWRDGADVLSWKTDSLHIIPCVHCGKEFVTFEQDLGLCRECAKLYDTEMFGRLIAEVQGDENAKNIPNIPMQCISEFVYDSEFRKKFLISELDKRDEEVKNDLLKKKWGGSDTKLQ